MLTCGRNNFLAASCIFSYLFSFCTCNFASLQEENVLSDFLKNRLTKNSPPGGMVNNTVYVYVDLYQIVDVDEKNGVLTLKLWLFTYYRLDESLWKPSEYKGVNRLQFPMDTFWNPDIGSYLKKGLVKILNC